MINHKTSIDLTTALSVLKSANIIVHPDGTHSFSPKAMKQYCGENTANQVADLERRLKIAVDALERLGDCDWVITLPDRMDGVRTIARDALAKIQEVE